MFGADASLLARIANREPEASLDWHDLRRVSPSLLPLAERLDAAGHVERLAIWDEFLAHGLDRASDVQAAPVPNPAAQSASLAERLVRAIVLVSHLTKGVSANGKRRVLGSIAYVVPAAPIIHSRPTRKT